jgi:hypothetical protein
VRTGFFLQGRTNSPPERYRRGLCGKTKCGLYPRERSSCVQISHFLHTHLHIMRILFPPCRHLPPSFSARIDHTLPPPSAPHPTTLVVGQILRAGNVFFRGGNILDGGWHDTPWWSNSAAPSHLRQSDSASSDLLLPPHPLSPKSSVSTPSWNDLVR